MIWFYATLTNHKPFMAALTFRRLATLHGQGKHTLPQLWQARSITRIYYSSSLNSVNPIASIGGTAGGHTAPEPWRMVRSCAHNPYKIPTLYSSLSKVKLSALVVATTLAGFELAPHATNYSLLGWTLAGVALSSFSANTFNQWMEVPFDSQMARTRTRPLPTHRLSTMHAFHYGLGTGMLGVGLLAWKAGALAAILSGGNILLYAAMYTPLKRISVANTWIGAVVGAIPPMIGYVAASGGAISSGCLLLGSILYCWQFPHFNSLSWNLKQDYSRAGYRMTALLNPRQLVNVSLRHSLALIPVSLAMIPVGVCSPWLLVDSVLLNGIMTYLAWQFRSTPSRTNAKRLFFYSLLHLPLLLLAMIIHKVDPEIDDDTIKTTIGGAEGAKVND